MMKFNVVPFCLHITRGGSGGGGGGGVQPARAPSKIVKKYDFLA